MIFPFSFWGVDAFAGKTFNLELFEDFTGWFVGWNGKVYNLELSEDFTNYFTAVWAGTTENLELFEDFSTGW